MTETELAALVNSAVSAAYERAAKVADDYAAAEEAEMAKPDFPRKDGPIFLRGYQIAEGIASAIRALDEKEKK